ncbi:CHAT domain-containing protein [Leptothoe sp. EHU-05/26/07-4]
MSSSQKSTHIKDQQHSEKLKQLLILSFCSLLPTRPALAQLIPDATTNTQIQPNVNVRGLPSDLIEGGTIRSDNLFHSFQEFNIAPGQAVYFANPLDISNIFSRITGQNTSSIDGTLGVLGSANLFLLNPNGIIFGPSASLDIPGSFTASTAEAFTFGDDVEFSATNPQAPPLLTLSVTPGVQLGQGDITNAGSLAVSTGQTLTLQGRNITHTGDLMVPGGTVGLFGETVGILDSALIDVSESNGGGTVLIGGLLQGANPELNAQRTFIGPNTRIIANALQSGNGGTVAIWSDQVTGFYGDITARGANNPVQFSNGGFVEVSSGGHLIFRGAVDTTAPFGQTGILLLDPTTITIANGTADSAADGTDSFAGNASGLAGQVLSAPLSAINDVSPSTIFESELEGLSGDTDVILQATDGITVEDLADNQLRFSNGTGRIAFIADANGDGIGDVVMLDLQDTLATNGRDLTISGANFLLGNIDTSTLSEEITVDVDAGGPIPATGTSGSAQFSFTVPDGVGTVDDLDVRFSAAHTFDADLTVTLTSPDDDSLILFDRVGGNGDNFQDTLFDDDAPGSINDGTAPFIGTLRPNEDLDLFAGNVADGVWILDIVDNVGGDSGELFKAGDVAPWGEVAGTQLLFAILTEGNGGALELRSTGDILANDITTSGVGAEGQGGSVVIDAGGALSLTNINTSANGGGGDIAIASQGNISINDFNTVAQTFGGIGDVVGGDSGNITIAGQGNVAIGNGNTSMQTFGGTDNVFGGDSGNIEISAQGSILTGDLTTGATTFSSNADNVVEGRGGNITLSTALGTISANRLDTYAQGMSGNTLTGADSGDITLSSTSGDIQVSSLGTFSNDFASGDIIDIGERGDITITTTSGNVDISSIVSRLLATGNNITGGGGGDLSVSTISGDVTLGSITAISQVYGDNVTSGFGGNITISSDSGNLDIGPLSSDSRVRSSSSNSAGGTGGDVRLSTRTGAISSDEIITSSNGAGGQGGAVVIEGGLLSLANIDTSASGGGGDISISSQRDVTIGDLTTGAVTFRGSAEDAVVGGDGGDISISSQRDVTIGDLNTEARTLAGFADIAVGGDGGDISISSQGNLLTGDLDVSAETFSGGDNAIAGSGGDIALSTTSGDILTGTLTTDTNSTGGNLTAGEGGDITLSTTSGNIQIPSILTISRANASDDLIAGNGGDIAITTTSGNIDISTANARTRSSGDNATDGSGGDFSVATLSGDVTLGSITSTSDISGDNVSGGSGGNLTVFTDSGNIDVGGVSLNSTTSNSNSSSAVVSGGTGGDILLSTVTGNISSRSLQATTIISGNTENLIAGTGGQVEIASEAGTINLQTINTSTSQSSSTGTLMGGRGGDISITNRTGDILVTSGLETSSNTSSSAQTAPTIVGGDGGNISITNDVGDITTQVLRTFASTSSSTGSTQGGDGGSITLSSNSGDITVTDSISTFASLNAADSDDAVGGDGGDLSIFSNSGEIDLNVPISTFSFSEAGASGNGGDISLITEQGNILGTNVLTGEALSLRSFSISENAAGSGSGGQVILSAQDLISGLDILTVSSQGQAGNLLVNGTGNLLLDNVDLITSATVSVNIGSGPPLIIEIDGIGESGDVDIIGNGDLTLGNSSIISSAQGIRDAGDVRITSPGLITIQDETQISSNTVSSGAAGDISINSDTEILVTGDNTFLSAVTDAQGSAGNILLNAPQLTLADNARITATATATATGIEGSGSITLNASSMDLAGEVGVFAETEGQTPAGTLTLQPFDTNFGQGAAVLDPELSILLAPGANISASTSGQGQGGSLQVFAPEAITIAGPGRLAVESRGVGDAGDIEIETQQLTLTDDVEISASTFGTLPLPNTGTSGFSSPGDAGDIRVNVDTANITNGATIQTNTEGIGNAGSIDVNVSDTLRLNGGAIAANTTSTSTGRGGNINVTANTARLSNGSITVNSQGAGQGGDISVDADLLSLRNQSDISATTASTDGGNISIQAEDALILADRSEINATAGTAAAGGDGGNIDINAQFIVALREGQNRITAEAFQGNGGNINIVTIALLGTEVLDISASSQFGLDGEVSINSPNLDPARGLTQLPTNLTDASNQIANACAIDQQGQAQFVVTGRGGLPTTPASLATSFYLLSDLGVRQIPVISQTPQPKEVKFGNPHENVVEPANSLHHLLQQAARAYHQADYVQAIHQWQQAAIQVSSGNDPLTYAAILSNLSLAYAQLGDWQRANAAIVASQQLLTPDVVTPQLLAQVLNARASLNLGQGNTQMAITDWQQAAAIYDHIGDRSGYQQAQLNQVQVLQSRGLYRQAQAQLQDIWASLENEPPSSEKAILLLTWGNSLRISGELSQAKSTLETAMAIAQQLNQPGLTSRILLNLGHATQADQALAYYQQAFAIAPTALSRFQASISQLRLQANQDPAAAQRLWANLKPTIQQSQLPTSHEAMYAQLNLVHTVLNSSLEPVPAHLLSLLDQLAQQSQILQDPIAEAYTLGYQGEIYRQQQQWQQAEALTQKAFRQAQTLQLPEVIYPVALQLGRLHKTQGKRAQAIDAYGAAIDALEILRKDLIATSDDVQFTFRDDVEPIYREFVKLLLSDNTSHSPQENDLRKARALIEALQVAEINDYFQDACVQGSSTFADEIDPAAAVIYPILLEERLDVIISVGGNLTHYSQPVSSHEVETTIQQLLGSLTSPIRARRTSTTQQLQQVYDWIIRPAEADLEQQNIENLVFVADGVLRTLPLTTLHDGEHYLIEKYNVVLSPGLSLLDPQPLPQQGLNMLVGGLSEARSGFPALPFVPEEVQDVTAQIPNNQVLLNQTLTQPNLLNSLKTAPANVVHLATHGEFGATADDTFILTWEGKLTMEEMSHVLRARNSSDLSPVELLVFSACKTASGDSRAVLGIAGTAIRSGVRSTLAGLWAINDQAAAAFMGEFYQALAQPGVTKAEAFRQAQLTLMQDPELASPYFWSPFVLVGNWL